MKQGATITYATVMVSLLHWNSTVSVPIDTMPASVMQAGRENGRLATLGDRRVVDAYIGLGSSELGWKAAAIRKVPS
ncbi:hypothetical protein [Bradyrhizobium sp.]|uniref:hypothetical protein n=1 Tax=Bradyrhizobium sp. TaxID=376 RepID=UPI002608A40A|nr:hypothetical protein [Bradyrhizobium sp.]